MTPSSRRVRIDLAYDGTHFAGWQVQPGLRTVQGVLEEALVRIQGGGAVRVRGAGRTDAGVHARGQVADALVESRLDDDGLLRSLGSILPRDVRPTRLRTVDPSFHARHAAISKTYAYLLDRSAHGDPFLSRFALHWSFPIDRPAVEDALRRLPGKRDWSGFAGAACSCEDRVREMTEASFVSRSPEDGVFRFTADGFLNHMVRNLVGTLLDVGRGRFGPERMDEILGSRNRALAGFSAPVKGLCLEAVRYPVDPADVPAP